MFQLIFYLFIIYNDKNNHHANTSLPILNEQSKACAVHISAYVTMLKHNCNIVINYVRMNKQKLKQE